MSQYWLLIISWILLSSFAGFLFMGLDKSKARSRSRRISERALFELALAGGVFGVIAGSTAFHHKTSKYSFMGIIFLIAILWIIILLGLQNLLGPPFG